MIRALFDAGVDVFRLNFSHRSHEDHGERVRAKAPAGSRRRNPFKPAAGANSLQAAHIDNSLV